jgi:hypothetical protein
METNLIKERNMKAPDDRPKRDPFPAGTYNAVCYGVIDMGTQHVPSKLYGDKDKRQVRVQWEVPALRVKYEKDGKELEGPKVIGKTYMFSTYKKAKLFEHLTAWGLTDLDKLEIETLIGRGCMLNVAHTQADDGDTISYISSVMQMPAGSVSPQLENPEMYYSVEEHGKAIPETMYPWLKKKIEECKELNEDSPSAAPAHAPDVPPATDTTDYADENIPF